MFSSKVHFTFSCFMFTKFESIILINSDCAVLLLTEEKMSLQVLNYLENSEEIWFIEADAQYDFAYIYLFRLLHFNNRIE